MTELEAILQANKRQRLSVERNSASVEESSLIYASNIQQKADSSLKWCERVFSSYLPCSAFSYEVTFPKDCVAPFDCKHQVFPYSVRDFNSSRKFSCLVIKTVKIYISAVIKPGDIVLKVNDTNLSGTADEPLAFEDMKSKLTSAKENSYVVRFMRLGATSTNFLPSPSEISLFQSDKNTAAKFSVVRDGSKPVEEDVPGAPKGKPATPLIQLIFLDSTLPVSIKKMMQGTKVSWEYHPVFINNVTLTLSNGAQTNQAFVPLPSSQYTASVMAPNHGTAPYHCFTGQHHTPLGNIHAPLKGPTAPPAPSTAASGGGGDVTAAAGGAVAVKTEKAAAAAPAVKSEGSESQLQQTQQAATTATATAAVSQFAGVFKERGKWVAVLEVPHRFDPHSEGYNVTEPCQTRQIFLGRFDHVEEARYVYKKMDSDWKTNGTFSTKRLARTLRSSGFTSIASNLNSAAASLQQSHGMPVTGTAGVGVGGVAGALDALGKPLMGAGPLGAAAGGSSMASLMNKSHTLGGTSGGGGGGVVGSTSLYKAPYPGVGGVASSGGAMGGKAPLPMSGAAPQGQRGVGSYSSGGPTAAPSAGQQQQWSTGGAAGGPYSYGKPLPAQQQQQQNQAPMMKGGVVNNQQHQQQMSRPGGVPSAPLQSSGGYKPPSGQMLPSSSSHHHQQQQQYLPPPPPSSGSYSYAPSSSAVGGPQGGYSNFGFAPVQSYYDPTNTSTSGSSGGTIMGGAAGGSMGPPMSDYSSYPSMHYGNSNPTPTVPGGYATAAASLGTYHTSSAAGAVPTTNAGPYAPPPGGMYSSQPAAGTLPGYSSALSAAGMSSYQPQGSNSNSSISYGPITGLPMNTAPNLSNSSMSNVKGAMPLKQQQQQQPQQMSAGMPPAHAKPASNMGKR